MSFNFENYLLVEATVSGIVRNIKHAVHTTGKLQAMSF